MSSKHTSLYLAVLAFIGAILVVIFFNKANKVNEATATKEEASSEKSVVSKPQALTPNKPLTRGNPRALKAISNNTAPADAIPNERIARFSNEEDYRAFLESLAARGLTLLGRLDGLRAVRFGFSADSNLNDIEGAEVAYNYAVGLPTPPASGSIQEDAVGFGASALEWLGVTGDHSSWGEGVTIAVIDSGINNHIGLSGDGTISYMDITELGGFDQLGHGTAVASIISGDFAQAAGVAPASDLISIRVTDENGNSDSFTLANGILQAIDAGVDLINISMGSASYSVLVQEAVDLARAEGIVIIASAGNSGTDQLAFPAGGDGVISVGAIEAQGEHAEFSNSGNNLDIVAPGYQVNAAFNEGALIAFSGTSASAPFVTGAIAAVMSEGDGISAVDAANIVLTNSNDAGYPGNDEDFGGGILDIGRIMSRNIEGVYDIAVAGQVLAVDNASEAWITIQNQGTEPLLNSDVSVAYGANTVRYNISSLAVGEIHTYNLPVAVTNTGSYETIRTNISISETDVDLDNNTKTSDLRAE